MFGELNKAVKEKGRTFQLLFYILLALYFTLVSISAILALSAQAMSQLLFSLMWFFAMLRALSRNNLYLALKLSLLQFSLILFLFALLPAIQIYLSISCMVAYLSIAGISLTLGLLYSLLFSKASDTSFRLLAPGILFSAFASFSFGAARTVTILIENLGDRIQVIQSLLPALNIPQMDDLFRQPLFDAATGFTLFFVFFNAPFIIYFLVRKDRNYLYLVSYIIPVFIFVLTCAILDLIMQNVLTMMP